MEKKVQFLIKVFSKKEYAEDFMSGKIRFGKLGYYQKIDCIRGDNRENITANLDPTEYEITFETNDVKVKIRPEDFAGPIQVQYEYLKNHYIYCLASAIIDDSKGIISLPERERLEKFGEYVVVIHNPKQLLERVKKSLKKKDEPSLLISRGVEYRDLKNDFFNLDEKDYGFIKDKAYDGENEYRLKLIKNDPTEEFIIYEIGDLNDIAKFGDFNDFKINGSDWEW